MLHEDAVSKLQGPYSAIFTPFDGRGQVNFEQLIAIAEYQMAEGITGFFVAGSTGEGLLLSEEERVEVVRVLVASIGDRATIIAHVGHPSTDVASRLAQRSARAGADWIAAVGPIYHGTTFDGAKRHYRQIAMATELPFMVYSLGGVIEPHRDGALFEIPNVCGLKYTGGNFYSVQQLQRFLPRPVGLMSGFDEQFVAGLSFGFHGGIGTTFNFGPQFYSAIYRHYRAGQIHEAARCQAQINQVTELMVRHENWSYRKAIMRYIGFDCGPARPPYAPLSESEYDEFARQLDDLDVLKRLEKDGA